MKLVDVLSPLRWHAGGQHLSLVMKQRNLFPKGTQASWAFEEWKRECYTRAACGRRADRRRQRVRPPQHGAERACAPLNGAGGKEGRVAVVLARPGINPHRCATSKEK